ncbi:MAG: hypothetical protein AAGB22_06725 [Bacteroidota bacterium]
MPFTFRHLSVFAAVLIAGVSFSCSDDEDCEDATVCVFNNTVTIVDGCWDCQQPEVTIPPGESACIAVPRNETVTFNLFGGGSVVITAADCQTIRNLQ